MIALTVFALLTFNWDLIVVSGTDQTTGDFVVYVNGLNSGQCSDPFVATTCKAVHDGAKWGAMCDAGAQTKCKGDYETASRADFTKCCTDCNEKDTLEHQQDCCAQCPETINKAKTNVVDFVSYIDVKVIPTCSGGNINENDCETVHPDNNDWKSMCGTLDKTSCIEKDGHVTPEQLKSCCSDCEQKDDSAAETACCVACPDSILTPDTTSEPENPTSPADNDKTKTTAAPESSGDETTEANGTDVTDTSAPLAPMTATWFKVIAFTALIEHFF